ncbi:hypothetical protein CRYUN_Cryun40dG0053000 [Craigia yunnanensis]
MHIDLSYNMPTDTIPTQAGNLKNHVGLDLSYNSLIGPIPKKIGQLAMLQKLVLSSNSLVEIGMLVKQIEYYFSD